MAPPLTDALNSLSTPIGGRLTALATGARARIVRLVGRKEDDDRLESIGLRPGVEVEVARKGRFGPMILSCGPMRVALDRRLAGEMVVDAPVAEAGRPSAG